MSQAGQRCSLYENPELQAVTGDTIRPGGFSLTERALSVCQWSPGAKVVDVGCGIGATVEYLVRHHQLVVTGVDPSLVQLNRGRQRWPHLRLLQAAGERLPFGDAELDGVLAECTLSLMDDDQALAEFARVLKPGGHLVVSDVYARNPAALPALRALSVTSCVTGAFAEATLRHEVQRQGFEILLWEDHSRLLAELAARLIFANGSVAAFWGTTCGIAGSGGTAAEVPGCGCIDDTMRACKPGYFLMIAKRAEE